MVNIAKGPALGAVKGTLAPSKCGSTQNMAANIKVVVRVRPLNDREKELNNRIVVDVVDDTMLVFDPKEEIRPFFYQGVQQPNKGYLKRANKELKFVFDHVCGQNASNAIVFETTTKDIIASLMEGYNCSVFVYGATGAGKTFTMIGNKENPGITYLTMEYLFYTISSYADEREFDIGVSYIEVYNENVYDLLKPSNTPLQLREDSKYGVMVAGLTLNNIQTARELLNMLENGNKNRTQHPTDANAESSRSHAVFQVYVKMRYKTSSQLRLVKLSMIDLAGSERASATGCVGERFKEGANINRSLLSLGNCINRLADGSSYIPYRDSKLTRLLKDSLGGNCKTVMIANVSPSSVSYEDTYNTLKYAARANKIQLSIKKNIVDGDMRLSQFVKINEELKKKVKELEAKLSSSNIKTFNKEPNMVKEKAKQEWRKRLTDEEQQHGALEMRLLEQMSGRRVLSLRQRLRARERAHIADLAHRSSWPDVQQVSTEEIPRQERAAESYVKKMVNLDSNIMSTWTKWQESSKKMQILLNKAATEYPELIDFVEKIKMQSEVRHLKASGDLRLKLLNIQNEDLIRVTEYTSEMPILLKNLYLILKGHDKAPPALTAEYLDIMKKAKSAKSITWSDEETECDAAFRFISTLDLNNPTTAIDYIIFDSKNKSSGKKDDTFDTTFDNKHEANVTIDIPTDSDDFDTENRDPKFFSKKRKGTPIKLANNETIIINDSLESLDVTRNINSAKKIKRDINPILDIENYEPIDPMDLNSTFVLGRKTEALKKLPVKIAKCEAVPAKSVLVDKSNIVPQRTNIFGDNKARVVKPVVGKAVPFRRGPAFGSGVSRDGRPAFGSGVSRDGRPATGSGVSRDGRLASGSGVSRDGTSTFGSGVSRDGTPLSRNVQDRSRKVGITDKSVGFKAVRAREREHPYSRLTNLTARK